MATAMPVSYRFGVSFFPDGSTSPVDADFKSVSGISSTVETYEIKEGGENLYTHNVPVGISHDNLVLQRGMIKGDKSNKKFMKMINELKVKLANIQVAPLDKDGEPSYGGWIFHNAYLVNWSFSDMDGDDNNLVIHTMEFTYNLMEHAE